MTAQAPDSTAPWPVAIDGWLLPLVARADRLAAARLAPRLARHGLTHAQFRIVGQLLGASGGLPQHELATRLRLDPSTVSTAVSALEARGILLRRPDPDDARGRRVYPTAGHDRLAPVLAVVAELEADLVAALGARDAAELHRLLGRLTAALDGAAGATPPDTDEEESAE